MKILSKKEIHDRLSPLFKEKGLELILLFGSVATKRVHGKSDIDLGFLFKNPVDIFELTSKVVRLLGDNVDVVDLRRANPLLKYTVVKYGKLIYERQPGVFYNFYSLAYRMYKDTNKLRSAQTKAIKSFIEKRRLA